MRDFRKLDVWRTSHQLVLSVYKATTGFTRDELYGLTSQMRRAASSVPMNIAEGCGRATEAEFSRFLEIAMGSASELDYQILLARDLGLLDELRISGLSTDVTRVKKMLGTLNTKVRTSDDFPQPRQSRSHPANPPTSQIAKQPNSRQENP